MHGLRKIVLFVLLVVVLVGCTKKEKKTDTPQKTTENGVSSIAKKEDSSRRKFSALSFTDNTNWINGVAVKDKNTVLLQIGKNAPLPVQVGYKLTFAFSGEAEILKVSRMEMKDYANVFITVNKPLDVIGDGNPNPIFVKSFTITPASANKAKVWRNGISLEHKGLFVFWIQSTEAVPVKIGDTLRFAFSGKAIVKEVNRYQGTAIVVKVDMNKLLDPEKDGFPNTVEVVLRDK